MCCQCNSFFIIYIYNIGLAPATATYGMERARSQPTGAEAVCGGGPDDYAISTHLLATFTSIPMVGWSSLESILRLGGFTFFPGPSQEQHSLPPHIFYYWNRFFLLSLASVLMPRAYSSGSPNICLTTNACPPPIESVIPDSFFYKSLLSAPIHPRRPYPSHKYLGWLGLAGDLLPFSSFLDG